MNDRAVQCRGLSCAAWGYFFLNFDFKIGNVSLIPRFVGFLLLLGAINCLLQERRDLRLLRPLAVFFAALHAVNWLLSFLGKEIGGHVVFFDLLVTAVELYFHFQFLTDIAALAGTFPGDGERLAKQLDCWKVVYALLSTAVAVVVALPAAIWPDYGMFYSKDQGNVLLMLAVATCAVSIVIMVILFRIKRCFQRGEGGGLRN